jgi:hypothetical protein
MVYSAFNRNLNARRVAAPAFTMGSDSQWPVSRGAVPKSFLTRTKPLARRTPAA